MDEGLQFIFCVVMVMCMIYSYYNIAYQQNSKEDFFKAIWWLVAAYMVNNIIF